MKIHTWEDVRAGRFTPEERARLDAEVCAEVARLTSVLKAEADELQTEADGLAADLFRVAEERDAARAEVERVTAACEQAEQMQDSAEKKLAWERKHGPGPQTFFGKYVQALWGSRERALKERDAARADLIHQREEALARRDEETEEVFRQCARAATAEAERDAARQENAALRELVRDTWQRVDCYCGLESEGYVCGHCRDLKARIDAALEVKL